MPRYPEGGCLQDLDFLNPNITNMAKKKTNKIPSIAKLLKDEGKDNRKRLLEYLDGLGETTITADGLDAAIIGVTEGCDIKVVYDHHKCIEIFQRLQEMSEEEAREWMSYNVTGAYVGESTPIFIHLI
jgi:hypothetical protein